MAAKPNRLAGEKSPYLLQHAHNPVDWYPWGEAAFQKAKVEDKPILLSVGYSTCHWCHVMERESFENDAIAGLMNRHFVCVKLDREERPDVDRVYMTAVQAMTGQGGWPLNVFLTPDLKPFYGGTYFPPESRWGRPGFPEILNRVVELWKGEREKIASSGEALRRALGRYAAVEGAGGPLDAALVDAALKSYALSFDPEHGGFGGAPKFPMPAHHFFLLRAWERTASQEAIEMSLATLRAMADGGIRDHLGGGFHRYSTDSRWHIPHFEKMLYDNAQLAARYADAYQATGEEVFGEVARGTIDYVLRDLASPGGAFCSAEDADSLPPGAPLGAQKVEGAFYLWTYEEILRLCGTREGELFAFRCGAFKEGNAVEDPHGEFEGKSHLHSVHTLAQTAAKAGVAENEAAGILEGCRKRLFEARSKRPRPHLDDKVLAGWNGLMIGALARAAAVLGEPRYAAAAAKAADFLADNLWDAGAGKLYRRWRDGERAVPGMADDHAFLALGLLDLYEATLERRWLDWAKRLLDILQARFFDAAAGGYFVTAEGDGPELLVRVKEDSDNVEPAAGSAAVLALLRLHALTGEAAPREAAGKTLRLLAGAMRERPTTLPFLLGGLCQWLAEPTLVAIAGKPGSTEVKKLLAAAHKGFLPGKAVAALDDLPGLKGAKSSGGEAAAYLCAGLSCGTPTSDPAELERRLSQAAKVRP